jgi:mono/diheme cytochrome c family protein
MLAKVIPVLIGAALLVRPAWAAEEVYVLWGNPRVGREVYVKKGCGTCHAIKGVGGEGGPDLGRPPTEHRTMSQYAGVLWNHAPAMREAMEKRGIPWKLFDGPEMRDLIAYLSSIQLLDDPGDPKRGERLFTEKGCASCHRIRGPELAQWQRYASPVLWAEVMWRHGPEMQEQMAKLGQPWPRFSGTEMTDLVTYIRSVIRKGP